MKKKFFSWLIGLLIVAGIVVASFPAPTLTQYDPAEKLVKVTFDAPFTLRFSQIMNQDSVEQAFQLSPEVEGEFKWKDWRTLEFYPAKPLTIGEEYQLTIKQTARNIWMRRMGYDVALNYVVTGPPYVLFVDPGEEKTVTSGAITVMFDRPMNLEGLAPEDLIQTDPKIDGTIRLMGKSAFQLIPKKLSPKKKYALSVPAGISALDGGKTKEAFSWSIVAPSLKVLKTIPSEGASDVNPGDSLRVYFNEEVALEGIKPGSNAQLFPSNDLDADTQEKMDGFFNTEVTYGTDVQEAPSDVADSKEKSEPQKNILVFSPTFPYQPGQEYRFALKSDSTLPLEKDFELKFEIAGGYSKATSSKIADEPAQASVVSEESNSLFEEVSPMMFFIRGENPKLKLKNELSGTAELSVCQIPSNEYIRVSARNGWNDFKCPEAEPVPLDPKDDDLTLELNKYANLEWVTGVYFASLKAGEKKSVQLFMVEDTSLFMKQSASDLFVWAIDIKSGAVIPDMEIEVLNYDGEEVARGITDKDGVFKTDQPFEAGLYVRAKKENEGAGRWGFVSGEWAFNDKIPKSSDGDAGLIILLNQDTFSPGDKLHFKGIWRSFSNHALALPEVSQVFVSIEGSQENFLESKRVPLRRNGSFDGSFELPNNSQTGFYWLNVSDVNSQRLTDPVPIWIQDTTSDLRLEWLEDQSDFPSSSAPVMLVKARYQNGIPAGGTTGTYELFRKPSRMNYEEGAVLYSFEEPKALCKTDCEREERVSSGEFVFDENGEAQLILTDDNEHFLKPGFDYELSLRASLQGSGPTVLSRTFKVHQGSFDLGLGIKHAIVQEDEAIEASILCLDFNRRPVVGQRVKLSLISDQGMGKTAYETILTSQSASYTFSVPEGQMIADGVYTLRAESQDERSNKVVSEQLLVLNRGKDSVIEDGLFMAVDQKKYFVGGRAHLLINEPNATKDHPVPVIVTYERDGLLDYDALSLSAPITEINVPIKENMFPRFLATVSRFNRGVPPSFSSVSREIEVGNDATQILIDLSYEPAQPVPGQELTLKFMTRDFQNQPMPSVLTVNLFDGDPREPDFSSHRFFSSETLPMSSASNISLKKTSSTTPPDLEGDFVHPDSTRSVYFNPVLATDITGKAALTLTLPEEKRDLTVEVIATKNESFFGHHSSVLKLNQRLLIQPILPSFAIPGDQTFFGASVQNLSDVPLHSRLDLVSSDFAQGDYSRNFSLQPGQQTEIVFSVLVDPLLEKDELMVKFKSEQDFAEGKVPLRHLKSSVPITDGAPIENLWTGRVLPPKNAHSGPGNLTFTLSGSPLAAAKVRADALDDMGESQNTYWLAAQLLSELAFLPASPTDNDLVAARSLLSRLQHSVDSNGGYHFWNEDSASPVLSALALWAFSEASLKGIVTDTSQVTKTIEYLWQAVDQRELSLDDRFFILWVLSENGEYDTERTLTLFREASELSPRGKAFLLLNLDRLVQAGQGSLASLIDSLKADLVDEITPDRKTTAILLYALSETTPENPLLKPMANLLFLEKDDLLTPSRDPEESLWTILSLWHFVRNSSSASTNFIAQIKLNGTLIMDQSVTNLEDLFQTSVPSKGLYGNEINDLFVKKEGANSLYLDVHLMSYLDPVLVPRTEEKMLILRHLYEVTDDGEKVLANTFKKGKHYLSELEFIVPEDSRYLMLSDEVPAGFRATAANSEFFSPSVSENGRLIYFAPSLPAGVYKVSTKLEAIWPGTYLQLPAVIHPLFEPKVVGRTEGGTVQVVE